MAPQLAEVADLERLLGRSIGDEHERAEALLDVASALVRAHCGWTISRFEQRVLWLDGRGGKVLALPCPHVTAVASVQISGVAVGGWSLSHNGLLRRDTGWPIGYRTVRVEYTGGYSEIPAQVKAVVVAVALRGLAADPAGGPALIQETVGPLSWRYAEPQGAGELTAAEIGALAPYRLDHTSAAAAS